MTVWPTVVETPLREQPLGAESLGTCDDGDDDDDGDYDGDEFDDGDNDDDEYDDYDADYDDGDDYGEDNHSVPGRQEHAGDINGLTLSMLVSVIL